MNIFKSIDLLIPKNIDLTKWSVVACDQYTSEPQYWEDVEEFVGDSPSSLHVIFPEIYLEDTDSKERIAKINKTMTDYLQSDLFMPVSDAMIYVKRDIGNGKVRHGLVGAVDLEEYDFNKGSKSSVRATEGTVISRIPPRLEVRNNAVLELPHIMLLIDDIDKTVIEPLKDKSQGWDSIYDFSLMKDSGRLTGYVLSEDVKNQVSMAIQSLVEKESEKNQNALIFAVGDGNHSLATAKTYWDIVKKDLSKGEQENHPARFALVELVNIHDESLEFEPIHRVVFGCNPENLIEAFLDYYPDSSHSNNGGQHIQFLYQGNKKDIYVKNPQAQLAVGTLQMFLDEYIEKNNLKIDYIHGEDVVEDLSKIDGNIGFLLPCMEKSELFPTVQKDGALPRKTFSMGEAKEKRFYMECKKIVK